jgi:hypothetical protein
MDAARKVVCNASKNTVDKESRGCDSANKTYLFSVVFDIVPTSIIILEDKQQEYAVMM